MYFQYFKSVANDSRKDLLHNDIFPQRKFLIVFKDRNNCSLIHIFITMCINIIVQHSYVSKSYKDNLCLTFNQSRKVNTLGWHFKSLSGLLPQKRSLKWVSLKRTWYLIRYFENVHNLSIEDLNCTKATQSKLKTGVASVNQNRTLSISSISEGTDDCCQLVRTWPRKRQDPKSR